MEIAKNKWTACISLFLLSSFLFPLSSFSQTFSGTVAQLRALTSLSTATTYLSADYGGGTWKYVPTSTKSDNTGTVLKPATTGRLERQYTGHVVNMRWFFVDTLGTTDASAAIISAHATGDTVHYTKGRWLLNSPGQNPNIFSGVLLDSDAHVDGPKWKDILVKDKWGNVVGIQHNYTEYSTNNVGGTNLAVTSGILLDAPLSSQKIASEDIIAHWYNDGGLETRRADAGMHSGLTWYYWKWNFTTTVPNPPTDTAWAVTGYQKNRHPLLGWYRGDDARVLDWQCYWMRQAGINVVNLTNSHSVDTTAWSTPSNANYWMYQLFHKVKNFGAMKYIVWGDSPDTGSDTITVQGAYASWTRALNQFHKHYSNFEAIVRNGKVYPVLYVWQGGNLRKWDGFSNSQWDSITTLCKRVGDQYKAAGFGGFALFARNGTGNIKNTSTNKFFYDVLDSAGCLYYPAAYGDVTGASTSNVNVYGDFAGQFSAPATRAVISVVTAHATQYPHPSQWQETGTTPTLFKQLLKKVIDTVRAKSYLPKMVEIYNVGEWAEGGPMLQPNLQDGFGYLDAVTSAIVYNTADYGILTDSTQADQAAKLQALINTVSANGGGTILFPGGKGCYISQVNLKSNVTIDGNGTWFFRPSVARFSVADNTPVDMFILQTVANVTLKNMNIRSNPNQLSVMTSNNPKNTNCVADPTQGGITQCFRSGPTSNITAIKYRLGCTNITFQNIHGEGLEGLISSNGGPGATTISHHIRGTNISSYHCQEPIYVEATDDIIYDSLHMIQWDAANGDPLNHALYTKHTLTHATFQNYTFESGGGVLITAAGNGTKFLNGTMKDTYAAIAFNDADEQGSVVVDGLSVDSCDYMVFQNYNIKAGATLTVQNFTVRRYHGSTGTGGPRFVNTRSNSGGTFILRKGTVYGNPNGVTAAEFWSGDSTHSVVFDSLTFVDYSTSKLFATYSGNAPMHKVTVSNCTFTFSGATPTVPSVFSLANSDSSLAFNNDFIISKAGVTGKFVGNNTTRGGHRLIRNRVYGFGIKAATDISLENLTTVMGTAAQPRCGSGTVRTLPFTNSASGQFLQTSAPFTGLTGGDTIKINTAFNDIQLTAVNGQPGCPVVIYGTSTVNRMLLTKSSFVKIVGSGSLSSAPDSTYPFSFTIGTDTSAYGLNMYASQDVEVGYVKFMGRGLSLKSTPSSSNALTLYNNWVDSNYYIHHTYVHHAAAEGLLLGHPSVNKGTMASAPTRLQGVEVAFNRVQHTGGTAIVITNGRTGNTLHDNVVLDYGKTATTAGMVLGGNTAGSMYNNNIAKGSGSGMETYGYGSLNVYNNTISGAGTSGTSQDFYGADYSDSVEANPHASVYFTSNTILGSRISSNGIGRTVESYGGMDSVSYVNNNVCFPGTPPTGWETSATLWVAPVGTTVNRSGQYTTCAQLLRDYFIRQAGSKMKYVN